MSTGVNVEPIDSMKTTWIHIIITAILSGGAAYLISKNFFPAADYAFLGSTCNQESTLALSTAAGTLANSLLSDTILPSLGASRNVLYHSSAWTASALGAGLSTAALLAGDPQILSNGNLMAVLPRILGVSALSEVIGIAGSDYLSRAFNY